MGPVLLLVPDTAWVDEFSKFSGANVLVLDNLLSDGLAGAYFRRLRILVSLHPSVRGEYQRKRAEYLKKALGACGSLTEGAIVIGTHAEDVDLYPFDNVYGVRLSDFALQAVSRKVYGDPLMLLLEYNNLINTVKDSVDEWYPITVWEQINVLLLRLFPVSKAVNAEINSVRQRQILRDILINDPEASVYLEDPIPFEVSDMLGSCPSEYEYLHWIADKWRDAVVRQLGQAPEIEKVFRLPWFVIRFEAIDTMCYRPNVFGGVSAAVKGNSLVDFVRSTLSSAFTSRELAGTWVGGILSDNSAAVAVMAALDAGSMSAIDDDEATDLARTPVETEYSVWVPPDFRWMYELVPDVVSKSWYGPRDACGTIQWNGCDSRWARTLPLAVLFSTRPRTPLSDLGVIQLMRRLHLLNAAKDFVNALYLHAVDMWHVMDSNISTTVTFDPGLTPLLPGANYLYGVIPSKRVQGFLRHGFWPRLDEIMRSDIEGCIPGDGAIDYEQLYSDSARETIYMGASVEMRQHDYRVGSKYIEDEGFVSEETIEPGVFGYCYLAGFQPMYHLRVAELLGKFPTLDAVLDRYLDPWRIPGFFDRIFVTVGSEEMMLHVELDVPKDENGCYVKAGVSMRDFARSTRGMSTKGARLVNHLRVGGVVKARSSSPFSANPATGCYGPGWYTLDIIMLSIACFCLFVFACYMLYKRCVGGGKSGFGRSGFFGRR